MQTLDKLVEQLNDTPIIFVGGKGGVGKTTTAAMLATKFAAAGQKILIVSTDPAHSLADVFNTQLSNDVTHLSNNLDAVELNPDEIVEAHFHQVERTISGYAKPDMMPKIREHLQLSKSAPGAQEAAMLEAICQYLVETTDSGVYQHIIFDTAPTGHTLRLLMLPEMMAAWTDGLLMQQRRQAKLKRASNQFNQNGTRKNPHEQADKNNVPNPFAKLQMPDRWQQAVEVLNKRQALFKRAGALLQDATKTAVTLVLTADNLPIVETQRSVSLLNQAHLTPAAIVVNQLISDQQSDPFWQKRSQRQQKMVTDIKQRFKDYPLYKIALQQEDIRGIDNLQNVV